MWIRKLIKPLYVLTFSRVKWKGYLPLLISQGIWQRLLEIVTVVMPIPWRGVTSRQRNNAALSGICGTFVTGCHRRFLEQGANSRSTVSWEDRFGVTSRMVAPPRTKSYWVRSIVHERNTEEHIGCLCASVKGQIIASCSSEDISFLFFALNWCF